MEWKTQMRRRKRVPTERTTKHSDAEGQDGEMSLSGHSERTEKPDSGMYCDSGCGDPGQDFIMHPISYRYFSRWERIWIMNSYTLRRRN